ncbi:MAG: PGN_0703 family putative restriction endonuclease [Polyangiaceae bacterium]
MIEAPTRAVYTDAAAQAAHCWFNVDRVPRDPAATAWKRRARWGQAQWRESRGYAVGFEPYRGGPGAIPVGSRLELAFARTSGANFVTPGALDAVRARLAAPERFQMLKQERLFADLLSSMPLCFNLFGDLAGDGEGARRAIRAWWPDAPSGAVSVRFEHSPGRRDPLFLGNHSAFDVAFDIDAGTGARAIVGVETKYHEHAVAEAAPKPAALARYIEVAERSGVFAYRWRERIVGTDLQQIWLDHLLVLAMLQHPSKQWIWGRFILAYPAGNPSFASAVARYAAALADRSTFGARTIEELLAAPGAVGEGAGRSFRERYL